MFHPSFSTGIHKSPHHIPQRCSCIPLIFKYVNTHHHHHHVAPLSFIFPHFPPPLPPLSPNIFTTCENLSPFKTNKIQCRGGRKIYDNYSSKLAHLGLCLQSNVFIYSFMSKSTPYNLSTMSS